MIGETPPSRFVDKGLMEIHNFSEAVGSGNATYVGRFPR